MTEWIVILLHITSTGGSSFLGFLSAHASEEDQILPDLLLGGIPIPHSEVELLAKCSFWQRFWATPLQARFSHLYVGLLCRRAD